MAFVPRCLVTNKHHASQGHARPLQRWLAATAVVVIMACSPRPDLLESRATGQSVQPIVSSLTCTEEQGELCVADNVCVKTDDVDVDNGYHTDCRTRLLHDPNASNRWLGIPGICRPASQEKVDGCIPHDWSSKSGGEDAGTKPTWSCLLVDEDTELCPGGEVFPSTFFIAASDVDFDCNGQTISPLASSNERVEDLVDGGVVAPYGLFWAATPWAIVFDVENSISGVTIRNCAIEEAKVGIKATRAFRDDGDSAVQGAQDACTISPSAQNRDGLFLGHNDIEIDNVTFTGMVNQAISIGAYSYDVKISNVSISDTEEGPAIYVDAGSTNVVIDGADIRRTKGREAIAIDSSFGNTVINSRFECNGWLAKTSNERRRNVAIALYKNGGEVANQLCPMRRQFGANDNIIFNNTFYGDAVNVASRTPHQEYEQPGCDPEESPSDYASRHIIECANMVGSDLRFTDEATGNILELNRFHVSEECPVGFEAVFKPGILVAGDETIVRNNYFYFGTQIRVGRPESDLPAIHVTVDDNKFYAPVGSEQPAALVAERDAATVTLTDNFDYSWTCKPFTECEAFKASNETCNTDTLHTGSCVTVSKLSWSQMTSLGLQATLTPY